MGFNILYIYIYVYVCIYIYMFHYIYYIYIYKYVCVFHGDFMVKIHKRAMYDCYDETNGANE